MLENQHQPGAPLPTCRPLTGAGNIQGRAADIAGFVREQPDHRIRDFAGISNAPHRQSRTDRLYPPFGLDLGVDPRPFVMVVALIASASFLTPIGYQTNLMVYGPGGYRFTDFTRVGLPLSVLLLLAATLLAPLVWPF